MSGQSQLPSQPPNVTQRFSHPTTGEGLINGPLKMPFINAVTEVVDVCSHLSKDVSFGLLDRNGEGFLVERIKTIRVHLTKRMSVSQLTRIYVRITRTKYIIGFCLFACKIIT